MPFNLIKINFKMIKHTQPHNGILNEKSELDKRIFKELLSQKNLIFKYTDTLF